MINLFEFSAAERKKLMRERKENLFIYTLSTCVQNMKKIKKEKNILAAGNRRACVCVEIDKLAARDSLTGGGGGTKRDFFSVFVRERERFGQRQKQTGGERTQGGERSHRNFFCPKAS